MPDKVLFVMMGNGNQHHEMHSRRDTLGYASIVIGGLSIGGIGVVAGDPPDKKEIDVTGQELFVPCLGEKIRIIKGTWVVLEQSQSSKGNCYHYNFHFHYKDGVTVEGLDSGRVWTGQGSKNESINACPPYPATQTVTNATTLTSEEGSENKVIQYKFKGHVTINANGEWTAAHVSNEFKCHGKNNG